MITSRRYDLDWLRVIAFFVLIYFHAAIFFIPGGLPMIQNQDVSTGLEIFVSISTQFRLALLFFISGVGVAFARRHRSTGEFILERSQRLLIPLALGIIVIVPPMVFTEKVFIGEVTGSFLEFYRTLFSMGIYPSGNLSWHHFWFIAYLYLFCLLAIKPFNWLSALSVEKTAGLVDWYSGLGIYKFISLLLIPELTLRWVFPGFRDLIHDWASFTHWFLIFLAGFMIANHERLLDSTEKFRLLSLAGAVTSTTLLFVIFGGPKPVLPGQGYIPDAQLLIAYVGWCLLRMTMVWCCILTCLGYAGRYLRFTNHVLVYVNEAVYPLFILHLTTLTVFGYYIVDLELHLWVKYLLLNGLTIFSVLAFYHLAIRPYNMMRMLFGVRAINHGTDRRNSVIDPGKSAKISL
jgi:glucan biosynthesis protein C